MCQEITVKYVRNMTKHKSKKQYFIQFYQSSLRGIVTREISQSIDLALVTGDGVSIDRRPLAVD